MGLAFILEATDFIECPCDPMCVAENICKPILTTIKTLMAFVLNAVEKVRVHTIAVNIAISVDLNPFFDMILCMVRYLYI